MSTFASVNTEALASTGNRVLDLKSSATSIIEMIKNDITGVKEYWDDPTALSLLDGFETELSTIKKHLEELELSGKGLKDQSTSYNQLHEDGASAFGALNIH